LPGTQGLENRTEIQPGPGVYKGALLWNLASITGAKSADREHIMSFEEPNQKFANLAYWVVLAVGWGCLLYAYEVMFFSSPF
jgi:hypothetical protein